MCYFLYRDSVLQLDIYFDDMTETLLKQQKVDSFISLVCTYVPVRSITCRWTPC